MTENEIRRLLNIWCRRLRITPLWDVRLDLMDDPSYRKTGDIKIDCEAHKAIVILNQSGAGAGNMEAVLVHELFHLKMYPLDQVTENLIETAFPDEGPARDFAYTEFFTALEQTVEEMARCFMEERGENKEAGFGRCERKASFDDLYQGLKKLD